MRRPGPVPILIALSMCWGCGRSGSEAVKRGLDAVTVPEGFAVELAAKLGLVRYPMLGTIAPDGAIYMCESSGKTVKTPEMTADPNYVVTKIEDTDKDGVYDKSTVFADKLTLPAGAVWHRGSVYVAAPPQVYRLQDTNGDGVADVREVVVEGWNLSANAASLHGPIMGPDGYLYLTDGRHGFKIRTRDGRKYEGKASRIWRVKPDGTGLEWYAGGGFDNPVEVVFTEGGDMFGTMTYFQDPADGQRDAILHFVEGGVYPKPYPVTEEFKRTGDLMPVMTRFARIAPSGLARYEGDGLGTDFRGNLFTAQFNAHRVQRHKVFREGATYRSEDSDFFISADPDMHPTDVMEDSDGSLIVVDTGAWFIHGCPLSRVSKPDVKGALYRIRRKGAARHAQPFVARKAAIEDETSVEKLAAIRASAKSVEESSAAVFALFRLGGDKAAAAVREALGDPRIEIRQAAARCAGMSGDKAAVPRLIEMLGKEEPPVRRQAAASLGMIADRRAVPALIGAAATAEDRFVEHSIIYSLVQLKDSRPLLPLLSKGDPRTRKAALIALDQMDASPLRDTHMLPLIAEADPDLRRAALWVVSRHAAWAPRLTQALEVRLRSPDFPEREADAMGDAMAAFCGESSMKRSIAALLGNPSLDKRRQLFLLDTAERCSAKQFPGEWTVSLARLLAHPDAQIRTQTIGLLRARGVAALDGGLRRLADSAAEPDEVRIAALSALGTRRPELTGSDFAFLTSRILPQVDANVKLAAGQVLGRAAYSPAQLTQVASTHIKAADPLVLPNLLDAFRNTTTEEAGLALVKSLGSVESSLGAVGGQRVEEILARYPQAVRDAAKPLLGRIAEGRKQRLEKVRNLENVLAARGDARRGRELFFGAKAGCAGCHTVGAEGGHVGPDLTSIGAIRSPHDLLEAIVLPSESFVPGHEVYRVETAREMYSGVLGKPAPDAVRLITGPGDEVRIPRKEIVKMGYAPVSLMPEGYDEILSSAEMTDLISFLRSQTSRDAAQVAVAR